MSHKFAMARSLKEEQCDGKLLSDRNASLEIASSQNKYNRTSLKKMKALEQKED